jgi:hypothetical protein
MIKGTGNFESHCYKDFLEENGLSKEALMTLTLYGKGVYFIFLSVQLCGYNALQCQVHSLRRMGPGSIKVLLKHTHFSGLFEFEKGLKTAGCIQ